MTEPTRCSWCGSDPLYVAYHDEEWGVPVRDDRRLFEKLLLEGAQAGLSWITILKRRDTYRQAFHDFDPAKIAAWGEEEVAERLQDPGIIRNRLKVEGAVKNARAFLEHFAEDGAFSGFLWDFVDGEPIQNAWREMGEMPAETERSKAMSKALKKHGFTFVGPTICYAFMQSMGLVNDHVVGCYRYAELREEAESIRAYDAAKQSDDEVNPAEQAFSEIDSTEP
ncbi:MAG TPA: DNA-3-methyladenine glycosylase I [Thermoanaerobaculia bacterium]|nr:DNA-3-methyladenine glycosylase I [Thermoanaerobaculia bacterium]